MAVSVVRISQLVTLGMIRSDICEGLNSAWTEATRRNGSYNKVVQTKSGEEVQIAIIASMAAVRAIQSVTA